MLKKIFNYPYDKTNDFVSSIFSKIGAKSFARKNSIFLIFELVLIVIITIINGSFWETFTGAYESTTVGGITSLFFSFLDNTVGDNFGLIALIGSGIVLILYDNYSELLSNCNYIGFVEWFETTLFYFTSSLIVFEIIDLFQKLIGLVDNVFFTLIFVPIIIVCAFIGIKALIDNFVILGKCILYGIIAEWAILLFIFVIGTPIIIHALVFLSPFLGAERLYNIHLALNDFQASFTDLQSSLKYQRIVVSIVFFIGYTIVNHREKVKAEKKAVTSNSAPVPVSNTPAPVDNTPAPIPSKEETTSAPPTPATETSTPTTEAPTETQKLGYFEGVLKNLGELDESQDNDILAIIKCFFKKPT